MTHEEGAMFYTGQAMTIVHPAHVTAHEFNDTGGIVYCDDGTSVSWRYWWRRRTTPAWGWDWEPFTGVEPHE